MAEFSKTTVLAEFYADETQADGVSLLLGIPGVCGSEWGRVKGGLGKSEMGCLPSRGWIPFPLAFQGNIEEARNIRQSGACK